jgi:hypothetical protein
MRNFTVKRMMLFVATMAVVLALLSWMLIPRASIQGIVTHKGQPLTSGTITFVPRTPAGRQYSGPIVQGRFSLPYTARGGASGDIYDVAVAWPNGPVRYNSASRSGLTVNLSSTTNTIDFDLSD